jgi:ferrous iron transport protein B
MGASALWESALGPEVDGNVIRVSAMSNEASDFSPVSKANPSRVVLIGSPNVGKSVIFNYLTGSYQTVSNYPGTTVEVFSGRSSNKDFSCEFVDTPGIMNLTPNSEDETVCRDILMKGRDFIVAMVLDAKNLHRGIFIAGELMEAGLPLVLVLNMLDEAQSRGIEINIQELGKTFGLEVIPTVAVQGKGLDRIWPALGKARRSPFSFHYSPLIEEGVAELLPLLPGNTLSGRSLALMLLSGDLTLKPWLLQQVAPRIYLKIDAVCDHFQKAATESLGYLINWERMAQVEQILGRFQVRRKKWEKTRAERINDLSTHPVAGLFGMMGVLVLSYFIIGVFGAGVVVDFLEGMVFEGYLIPFLTRWVFTLIPFPWIQELLVGPYGVLSMALTYALALILPIIVFFFLVFGFLEDSGYLPRLAVMGNRFFRLMGLNGKAVLPMILGLGCDTMATMTTRILEKPKDKIIVTLLLALGVPCSAQLAVIMGLLSGFPILVLILWVLVIMGVLFTVGYMSARIIPGRGSDFIMLLPPLRWPVAKNILKKTMGRVQWYLREAVPLFALGSLILFIIDRTGGLQFLESGLRPVIVHWLGLPLQTTAAFIIGFLRRDYGAAGFFTLAQNGLLTTNQILVGLVTITLFVPCLANVLIIIKERGLRAALVINVLVIAIALLVGGTINGILRVLKIAL